MPSSDPKSITLSLLSYCKGHDWAGYDPYDALNSHVFKALPFLDSRFPRLALTQLLKRSPIDIRPLLFVPRTQNPKALALFLVSLIKLSKLGLIDDEKSIDGMIDRIVALRSPGTEPWCWGYSFPWQTRTIVVPRATPNLVCTTFVADALLDAYECTQDARCLTMALSAAEYILNELYWDGERAVAGFSYPLPSVRAQVHNANFLAAALFSRVAHLSGEEKFLEPALKVARYSASQQREDGSWAYGELPTQNWIDNFHTGYNLDGLQSISKYAGTNEFEGHIQRGLKFYVDHFFRNDGAPKYFHDRVYPIDIHCVAQGVITLLAFKDLDERCEPIADSVLAWAINNMWDERGYFYYRVLRFCKIRTSYMRWSQSWMLLSLSTFLEAKGAKQSAIPAIAP